jgi:phosphoglucosamine mutase
VRPSGTEPVVRIMAEGGDDALIQAVVDDVCRAVQQAGA